MVAILKKFQKINGSAINYLHDMNSREQLNEVKAHEVDPVSCLMRYNKSVNSSRVAANRRLSTNHRVAQVKGSKPISKSARASQTMSSGSLVSRLSKPDTQRKRNLRPPPFARYIVVPVPRLQLIVQFIQPFLGDARVRYSINNGWPSLFAQHRGAPNPIKEDAKYSRKNHKIPRDIMQW